MNMRMTFACTMLLLGTISLAGNGANADTIKTPKAEELRKRTVEHLHEKANRFKLQTIKQLRAMRSSLQARTQMMERLQANHADTVKHNGDMIDKLTGMGIFETFAEKEISISEVQEQVNDAFRDSWNEHLKTMQPVLMQRDPGTAQIIMAQHRTFAELKRTMIPVIVSILLEVK